MTSPPPGLHKPYFTGYSLDRAATLRIDAARLGQLIADPTARFLPFWRRHHLLSSKVPAAGDATLAKVHIAELGMAPTDLAAFYWVFLGFEAGNPLFGIDLSPIDTPPATLVENGRTFVELRPYEFLLAREDAAIMAQLRAVMNWRATCRFCGLCGAPTTADQGGYHASCVNGHEHFPRTDPVAIMLVHHRDKVLLAKGTRFPNKRLMSALSGFVDPGESVEQAALREVFEEVGVRGESIRYHSSQPWPFPGLIMMGFRIEADSPELHLDPEEIAEARWLTRAEVSDHEALGFDPPSPNMMAGQLLKSWMEEGAG